MLKMRFIWSIYSVTEQDRQEKRAHIGFYLSDYKKNTVLMKKSKKMYSKSLLQSLSLQNFVYYNHFW